MLTILQEMVLGPMGRQGKTECYHLPLPRRSTSKGVSQGLSEWKEELKALRPTVNALAPLGLRRGETQILAK